MCEILIITIVSVIFTFVDYFGTAAGRGVALLLFSFKRSGISGIQHHLTKVV